MQQTKAQKRRKSKTKGLSSVKAEELLKPESLGVDVLKWEDEFYIQAEDHRYIIDAYGGASYWFPRLGETGAVMLRFVGGPKGTPVRSRDIVQLQTTETKVGDQKCMGAFADSHECYYWPGYGAKTNWRIIKKTAGDDIIHYGDQVQLYNQSYVGQCLIVEGAWLTTAAVEPDTDISTVPAHLWTMIKKAE